MSDTLYPQYLVARSEAAEMALANHDVWNDFWSPDGAAWKQWRAAKVANTLGRAVELERQGMDSVQALVAAAQEALADPAFGVTLNALIP